ncbi:MAG: hypothetical protein WC516_08305 [Patescibacteria group bacterium]|jgi:hypothetical protein
MNIEEIEQLFYSDIPITILEKQFNIDQRKILFIWRRKFGTSKRKISSNDTKNYQKILY